MTDDRVIESVLVTRPEDLPHGLAGELAAICAGAGSVVAAYVARVRRSFESGGAGWETLTVAIELEDPPVDAVAGRAAMALAEELLPRLPESVARGGLHVPGSSGLEPWRERGVRVYRRAAPA